MIIPFNLRNPMLTIIWDVDDVLNDLMFVWFEQAWRPCHPECRLSKEDLSENPPHRLLGVSHGEYLASLDAFRLSEKGICQLTPVSELLAWFHRHGNRFRHAALTATPMAAAPLSAKWVFKHFGFWIRSVNFVPSKREGESIPAYDRNKGEYLQWCGRGDVVVDDNPQTIAEAAALGLRSILIPRPWNRSDLTLAETLEFLATLAN